VNRKRRLLELWRSLFMLIIFRFTENPIKKESEET
jgi:hypothetical protein